MTFVMKAPRGARGAAAYIDVLPLNGRRGLGPEEIVDLEVEEVEKVLDIATTSR